MPVLLRTIRICATVTFIDLVIAFPFAFWLAKLNTDARLQIAIYVAMLVPFFLSPAARIYAWRSLLSEGGVINDWLSALVGRPLPWLIFSEFSIHFGLLTQYFTNMVWPLVLVVGLIDRDYLAASSDLGASHARTFVSIVFPLALPGIIAGVVFTFIPMLGDAIVAEQMGGNNVLLLSGLVRNLVNSLNYPVAAAVGVAVLGILFIFQLIFAASLRRHGGNINPFSAMGS